MDQEGSRPGLQSRIIVVAVVEFVLMLAIIVVFHLLLGWPVGLPLIALILAPAVPCGAYIAWLVSGDNARHLSR